MPLETETAFFEKHRREWLDHGLNGKWAVVHASTLIGHYDTLALAYSAGVAKVGNNPFLVKQVTPTDQVETIQRVHWGSRESSKTG